MDALDRQSRSRRPPLLVLGAVLALLLPGCQATPSASPQLAAATDSPAPTDAEATAPTVTAPVATIPPPPPPTTSAEKIIAAEAAGTIDHETALIDRVFAQFADARLPAEFRGDRSEDADALDEAHAELSSLSPAAQAALRPYLVRPADPSSYWNQEPPVASTVTLAAARGPGSARTSSLLATTACDNGWMHTQVSPNIPVMIWAECWASPVDAAAQMAEARGYMATLWKPETDLMGIPPGDKNIPNDDYDDTPETGDGLLDIYLLDGFTPSGIPRDLEIGDNYGVTGSAPPFDGPAGARTVAAYIVIMPGLTGLSLESTLAHEFFHALEYGVNREGLMGCPPSYINCGARTPHEFFWMTEASATWAEHYFVPAARGVTDGPYSRFRSWLETALGLPRTIGDNEYQSWMWPLFVQQQAGAKAVGSIWHAYAGKNGFKQLQAATSSVVPFAQQFREFAVRGANQLLTPGDPLARHYFDPSLDAAFPHTDDDVPKADRVRDPIDLNVDHTVHTESLQIDSLSSIYQLVSPGADAKTVVLDFTALAPDIDVDGIVELEDGSWQRRPLDGQQTWCLDKPEDAIRQVIVVFADHDEDPAIITRNWSWEATEASCGQTAGTLTYTYRDSTPITNEGGGSTEIDISVQVHLKANDGSQFGGLPFLNDGSTYGVTETIKSVLPAGPDGCQPKITTVGTPGGSLAADSISAGPYVDDDGKNRLNLGGWIPVHEEVESFYCSIGTGHSSDETSIQIPDCDGIETASAVDSQTFTFDCEFRQGTVAWAVTGTVILTR